MSEKSLWSRVMNWMCSRECGCGCGSEIIDKLENPQEHSGSCEGGKNDDTAPQQCDEDCGCGEGGAKE